MSSATETEKHQAPGRNVDPNDVRSTNTKASNGFYAGPRSDGSRSPAKSRNQKHFSADDGEKAADAPALKPRTTRWADEVDEDDQFIPTRKFASESRRAEPRIQRQESETSGRTRPATSNGKRYEDRGYPRREDQPRADRRKGGKGVEMRPRDRQIHARVESSKTAAPARPSKQEIEEIAHMKEVMAKKADERKRLKEDEEARLEAERRARCEAKLREIEEKKRSRTSSTVLAHEISRPTEAIAHPEAPREPIAADPARTVAFNSARRGLRDQREHDRKGDERLEIIIPHSTSITAPNLSPNAKEFIPTGPVMPMHHWPPYHQHPGAPHHLQGHHMPPMVQPGMVPPHIAQQLQQPQMGYGFHQYPPHFAPYGYPHPPPAGSYPMGNHYY